jgi:hypothetical protein
MGNGRSLCPRARREDAVCGIMIGEDAPVAESVYMVFKKWEGRTALRDGDATERRAFPAV